MAAHVARSRCRAGLGGSSYVWLVCVGGGGEEWCGVHLARGGGGEEGWWLIQHAAPSLLGVLLLGLPPHRQPRGGAWQPTLRAAPPLRGVLLLERIVQHINFPKALRSRPILPPLAADHIERAVQHIDVPKALDYPKVLEPSDMYFPVIASLIEGWFDALETRGCAAIRGAMGGGGATAGRCT